MKTIFLTGGRGFIGKNIIEQLGGKYAILAPTSEELDLADAYKIADFFKNNPVDIVIHSAKIGGTRKIADSSKIAELNTRMFFNIVRNEKYFKKMIFLGSGAEYDNTRSLVKVKETDFDKFVPEKSFFFYKYVCSKYIEKSDKIINLRIFGIYGKYEDCGIRFISNAICKNIFDLPISIEKNVFFDYVYINNFIRIIDYFISHDVEEKFYNIGTGKGIDLMTIAKIINKISDKKSEIVIKKKGLKNEYTCDNTRLVREISNVKFTDLEQGIKELYYWYKSIKHTLKKETFLVDK